MSGYKKHFIDIAFNETGHSTVKYLYGLDIYGGFGYGVLVKHISFSPAENKSDETQIPYMQGNLNYYDWFEDYCGLAKWNKNYEMSIECKIEYDNLMLGTYDSIVEALHGTKQYWHIVRHYVNDLGRLVDNYGGWLYGTIEVGDLASDDTAWTFKITIKGPMEWVPFSEEEDE